MSYPRTRSLRVSFFGWPALGAFFVASAVAAATVLCFVRASISGSVCCGLLDLFALAYERTIPVVGGGRVRFRVVDLNCRHIKNCGSAPGYPCANKARTVDISAASPQPLIGQPPAGLDQPGLGETADHAGQWVLIDATGFTTP